MDATSNYSTNMQKIVPLLELLEKNNFIFPGKFSCYEIPIPTIETDHRGVITMKKFEPFEITFELKRQSQNNAVRNFFGIMNFEIGSVDDGIEKKPSEILPLISDIGLCLFDYEVYVAGIEDLRFATTMELVFKVQMSEKTNIKKFLSFNKVAQEIKYFVPNYYQKIRNEFGYYLMCDKCGFRPKGYHEHNTKHKCGGIYRDPMYFFWKKFEESQKR